MGEIKSARELAMEKVERLGKLSPEELQRQKIEKYGPIGRGLAEKYLSGLALRDLKLELDKHKAKERDLVSTAMAAKLVEAIELGDEAKLSRIFEAMLELGLMKEEDLAFARSEITRLLLEYQEAAQKKVREVEAAARNALHQLRISGSAIGDVNPRIVPEWNMELNRIAQPYHERLNDIKARLRTRFPLVRE